MAVQASEIKKLRTEQRNPATLNIDLLPTLDMVRMLNDQNRLVADAVDEQAGQIAAAVELITERMRKGGRLIYIGAGTSGRLGVMDASEIPPTFSMPPEGVVGLIAGGDNALRSAVEHVEDDPLAAVGQLKYLGLYQNDVVCGIAASGRTPYVIGALDYARSVGAGTISVGNNKHSEIGRHAEIAIEVDTGPEALSGSTRLKAGTAQKMVLNLLSTATMIQQGKTYSNLMVDVKATNEKLQARCLNILQEIFPALERERLAKALESAGGRVKLAAVILKTGLPPEQARAELERCGGHLRRVFGEA